MSEFLTGREKPQEMVETDLILRLVYDGSESGSRDRQTTQSIPQRSTPDLLSLLLDQSVETQTRHECLAMTHQPAPRVLLAVVLSGLVYLGGGQVLLGVVGYADT